MMRGIICIGLMFVFAFAKAQINPSLVLELNKGTTAQIDALGSTDVQKGAVLYDTDLNVVKQFNGTNWQIVGGEKNTVVLNKNGGTLQTGTNTFYDFPLTDQNELVNDGSAFTVAPDGHITINETGTYLFAAGLSSRNLPQGSHKYIISLFIDGTNVGYLNRGFVDIPTSPSDFWGTSGTILFPASAGDEVIFRYVLNNGNNPVNAVFVNAGITKL